MQISVFMHWAGLVPNDVFDLEKWHFPSPIVIRGSLCSPLWSPAICTLILFVANLSLLNRIDSKPHNLSIMESDMEPVGCLHCDKWFAQEGCGNIHWMQFHPLCHFQIGQMKLYHISILLYFFQRPIACTVCWRLTPHPWRRRLSVYKEISHLQDKSSLKRNLRKIDTLLTDVWYYFKLPSNWNVMYL